VPAKTSTSRSELAYEELLPDDSAAEQRQFTTEALAELQQEVARLRTAVEVLQRQNGELVSIRQAFEAERRRYREMLESAPDGYVLTTLGGVILEANYVAAALLGVRQDFLISKSFLVFVNEEARAGLEAMLAQWRDAEQAQSRWRQPVVRGRTQLRVYKGAAFPAEYTISPTRDEHDRIVGLRWILRDLSESARTEQALRELDYHYRTLFDNAGDAIFIHNLTGRFLEVNRVACEILGYTRDELLRMTPADVTVPELAAKIPVLNAQLRHEDHIFFEMTLRRRDGTPLPMELNSRIIEYAGGPAVLSIARDITERKRGEEALARWAAQLALLSNVGRQIAAILGLDQVLERAAQLVHDNFGYHHVALFIVDRESRELVMKAMAGEFVKLFPSNHRIPLGQGMVGWAGEQGRRLLADDVDKEPHYINFYPDLIPTRSELSVPIRSGNQTIGVLDIQSPHCQAFDENDVKVMETLADQIAVAIANAQLFRDIQEARKVAGTAEAD
jgi:PAS domain S-box-containing protein